MLSVLVVWEWEQIRREEQGSEGRGGLPGPTRKRGVLVQLRCPEALCTAIMHPLHLDLSTLLSMETVAGNKILASSLLTYIIIATGESILEMITWKNS